MKWGILNIFLLFVAVLVNTSFIFGPETRFKVYCKDYNGYLRHPVHISYTNVEYIQKESRFDVLFKLFVDDFGLILGKKYNKTFDLLSKQQLKSNKEFIDKYITDHFKLTTNGKEIARQGLKLDSLQVKEQAIWLFYKLNTKGSFNNIEIHNSLMTDLYVDQTNLLIFSYRSEQKALKFSSTKTIEKITF